MMKEVEFAGSYVNVRDCPNDRIPQYAFVGRSNVGKSSLINALTGRKSLARISKQPGKTQLINFFQIDQSWYLVDLPGYGYARESKTTRSRWEQMVRWYLRESPNLMTAFLLIDSNIPPQKRDLEFMNWMGQEEIPFSLVYTKVDRHRKSGHRETCISTIREKMLEDWSELPAEFEVSAVSDEGVDQLLTYIGSLNATLAK